RFENPRRLPPGITRPLRPPARTGRVVVTHDRNPPHVRAVADRERPPRREGLGVQLQEPWVGREAREAIAGAVEGGGREECLSAIAAGGGRGGGDVRVGEGGSGSSVGRSSLRGSTGISEEKLGIFGSTRSAN